MLLLRLRLALPLPPGAFGGVGGIYGVPECVDWGEYFRVGRGGTFTPVRSTRLVLGAILNIEFSTGL